MPSRDDNLRTVAAAVLFVAVVVGVIYVAGDGGDEGGAPARPVTSSTLDRAAGERTPLPVDITRIAQLMDIATQQALAWKDDARAVRLYATDVAPDGTFDRNVSMVQLVFVSGSASQTQDVKNGWRWSATKGGYSSEEIWQQPPPRLDGPAARLCDLAEAAGDGGPARFTIDARFAGRDEQPAAMTLFARKPRRWMVRVDPGTCTVLGRSTLMTEEESRERDAAADDGGAWFDGREASKAMSVAIDAAGVCRRDGGPIGAGTVSVTFDPNGRAAKVQFLAGAYAGTDVGRCLEQRLLSVRVAPWSRGEGRAAARFRW